VKKEQEGGEAEDAGDGIAGVGSEFQNISKSIRVYINTENQDTDEDAAINLQKVFGQNDSEPARLYIDLNAKAELNIKKLISESVSLFN